MPRKEFVHLIESNVLILTRLSERLQRNPTQFLGFPRQQMAILVRLHIGGGACLKDIANREHITTPNLCAAFRKLESSGLVQRTVDEKDRRNTWYSVTPAGEHVALAVIERCRAEIENVFKDIAPQDEQDLAVALKTINNILTKMEKTNA